jgi:hypothetical protein
MPKTQKTKGGAEIPVPKRGDFFSNLKKAATPEKESGKRGPKQK